MLVAAPAGTTAASSTTQSGVFTARFEATDMAGTVRQAYAPGDRVRFALSLTNHSAQVQTLSFSTFQDREFRVLGAGGLVWSYGRAHPQPAAPRQISFLAGQTQVLDTEWDLKDLQGQAVAPGTYAVEAEVPATGASAASLPRVAPISVVVQSAASAGALSATFLAKDASGRPSTTFLVGDRIALEVTLSNGGVSPVTLNFATSQTHEFRVLTPGGGELWRSSYGKVYTQGFTQKTIPAGQTVVFTEAWDGRDNQGVQVQGGTYRIEAALTVTQLLGPVALPSLTPLPITLSGQVTATGDFASRLEVLDASGRAVTSMAPGLPVSLDLVLTNTTSSIQTLFFVSSKMYDFVVHDASFREVWRYSTGRPSGPAFVVRAVGPGASLRLRAAWDGTDSAGLALTPGIYRLSGEVFPSPLGSASVAASAPTAIDIQGAPGSNPSGAFRLSLGMKDGAGQATSSMRSGDTVRLSLGVTNTSGLPQTLSFPSGQQFDFVVRDVSGEVWRWSRGRAFTMAFTTMGFLPGQARDLEVAWDGRDSAGMLVRPGLYTLTEDYFTRNPLVGSVGSVAFTVR
ncbi:MAG: hypothetical protein HY722_16950 [Planctomycetes bacterium]|nr:hypothetical protein [Planctomycetota bacterium]